jgi:hypothetical protein
MRARGIDGGGGDDIGIVVARFGGVLGGQNLIDFGQPHPRDRIEQARINFEALRIDNLRICRSRCASAYGGDFSVANHHRAVFDHRTRQRVNLCVGDGKHRGARSRGSLGTRLRP